MWTICIAVCSVVIVFTCLFTVYVCKKYYFDLKNSNDVLKDEDLKTEENKQAIKKDGDSTFGIGLEYLPHIAIRYNFLRDDEDKRGVFISLNENNNIIDEQIKIQLNKSLISSKKNQISTMKTLSLKQGRKKDSLEILTEKKINDLSSSFGKVTNKDYLNSRIFDKIGSVETENII